MLEKRQVPEEIEERKIFISPLPALCFKITAGPRHLSYSHRQAEKPCGSAEKGWAGEKQGRFLNMECKG